MTACTHLGRPKGEPDPDTTSPPSGAPRRDDSTGVVLLENLRFSPGEEANDPAFVPPLVEGQDSYVNDAFGVVHRATPRS